MNDSGERACGPIERDSSYERGHLFRVRACGSLAAARVQLEGAADASGARYQTSQRELGGAENEVFGFLRGGMADLQAARQDLSARAWRFTEQL